VSFIVNVCGAPIINPLYDSCAIKVSDPSVVESLTMVYADPMLETPGFLIVEKNSPAVSAATAVPLYEILKVHVDQVPQFPSIKDKYVFDVPSLELAGLQPMLETVNVGIVNVPEV
jgi:hypothetical protein